MYLTGQGVRKLKFEISGMSKLKNEIELEVNKGRPTLRKKNDSLKTRVRWLEVATTNVNDKYTDCKLSI